MIYEFAIDPNCLSNWDRVRYFLEKVGFQNGRLIAAMPRKNRWRRMVYDACLGSEDVEKLRITEKLAESDILFLESGRAYDGNVAWLENAEREHGANPFRAIIADANPRAVPEVLLAGEVTDATHLWNVSRGDLIERRAEVLAQRVAPLLVASREILFIDPYFNPSRLEFRRPLEHLVRALNLARQVARIEYHLSEDHLNAPSFQHFQAECHRALPAIIPAGIEIRFIRWRQRAGGREIHARYILTDLGGIDFDPGLDEGEAGEMTKVSLLTPGVYSQIWLDYQINQNPTTYEFVDEVRIIGVA